MIHARLACCAHIGRPAKRRAISPRARASPRARLFTKRSCSRAADANLGCRATTAEPERLSARNSHEMEATHLLMLPERRFLLAARLRRRRRVFARFRFITAVPSIISTAPGDFGSARISNVTIGGRDARQQLPTTHSFALVFFPGNRWRTLRRVKTVPLAAPRAVQAPPMALFIAPFPRLSHSREFESVYCRERFFLSDAAFCAGTVAPFSQNERHALFVDDYVILFR